MGEMSTLAASRPGPLAIPVEREDGVALAYMTFDEWLEWDYEGGLSAWVDGQVRIYMSVSLDHDIITGFIRTLFDLFGEVTGLGRGHSGPYAMRAAADGPGREPDVMFVLAANRERRLSRFISGPPDVVVEVVSPDSVTRDNREKLAEYEQAGVPEYWVIDPRPNRQFARFYVLEDGRYFEAFPDEDGVYHSTAMPGFWLRLSWLWEEEPRALAAWTEIAATIPKPPTK